jgi:hypothetical protein
MGYVIRAFGTLVLKPEGKRPLGETFSTREDNIKRGPRDVGSENIPSMNVAEARIRFLDVATITELLISL